MKILRKYNTLINYSFDPRYLENQLDFSESQYTSSHWTTSKDNTAQLQYDLYFFAKNKSFDNLLLNYHSRLNLDCIIDDIERDAEKIILMKEELNISAHLFLMQNTQDFWHLFGFKEMSFKENESGYQNITKNDALKQEIKSIMRVLETQP